MQDAQKVSDSPPPFFSYPVSRGTPGVPLGAKVKIDRALTLPQAQDALERAAKQDEQLREASKMYEQHFMREMVKAMRQATPDSGLIETSFGEKIYREQLDNEYVETWSKGGGVGLADLIYNNIRERFFPGAETLMPQPKGPLPLEKKNPVDLPEWRTKALPVQPDRPREMTLRFEGEGVSPGAREIRSPWSGRVQKSFNSAEGLGFVEVLHDQGLVSSFVFAGAVEGQADGRQIQAGEKLGLAQGPAPWLQWKMTRG